MGVAVPIPRPRRIGTGRTVRTVGGVRVRRWDAGVRIVRQARTSGEECCCDDQLPCGVSGDGGALLNPTWLLRAQPRTADTAVGQALHDARTERALSVETVMDRLGLSRQQVCDLEQGVRGAFHNEGFFQRAQARYVALLGVEAPAPSATDEPSLRLSLGADPRFHDDSRRTRVFVWVVLCAVVVALMVAFLL